MEILYDINNEEYLKELEDIDIEELDKSEIVQEYINDNKKSKRGRKSSLNKTDRYYFSDREEKAVLDFNEYNRIIDETTKEILSIIFGCKKDEVELHCSGKTIYEIVDLFNNTQFDDVNKLYQISEIKTVIESAKNENEKIFNNILHPAFTKMIESIMRRYHLFVPNEESGDTFSDTMSFLITKMNKFNENKNNKAYSYYGNICKNYIIGKIQQFQKSIKRNPSYDNEEGGIDIINDSRYATTVDNRKAIAREIVKKLTERINIMTSDPKKYDLKENEVKLGRALTNLFENWDFVMTTSASNKLNKSACLFFLREQTGMDTKGVRDNMKKFQKEFLMIKNYVIEK